MDRRSHYLEVALRLFAEHGYHGSSIDQIVAEAGGSKATLYRYFASKEELFEAIIESLRTPAGSGPEADDLHAVDLAEGLRRLGTATADAALDDRVTVLMRLAVGEYNRFPDLARLLFERGPGVSYARLRHFLAARQAAGEIEVPDVQIAAEQFLGGIVGHQQLRMALGAGTPSAGEVGERVDAAVATFLRAYRAQPPVN